MKRATVKRAIALVIALVALVCVAYKYRLQLEAKVWHWRHGNFVALARYEIPVPSQWVVLDWDQTTVELSDMTTGSVVFISVPNFPPSHPHLDLNSWASACRQIFVRDDVQRSLKMGDETVLSLGERATEPGLPRLGISDLTCASSRRLLLSFTGPQIEVQQFYAIVQGIRRK